MKLKLKKKRKKSDNHGVATLTNVFSGQQSEDECERVNGSKSRAIQERTNTALQSAQNRASKLAHVEKLHADALSQNSTVFDYDGWKRTESTSTGGIVKRRRRAKAYGAVYNPQGKKMKQEAKYIGALKEKAEARKRAQGIIAERRLVKKQEEERQEFGDTDVFVTTAYRRKLEEDKLWQEKQDRLDESRQEDIDSNGKGLRDLFHSQLNDMTRDGSGENSGTASKDIFAQNDIKHGSTKVDERESAFEDRKNAVKKKIADATTTLSLPSTTNKSGRKTTLEEIEAARQRYFERKKKRAIN